MPDRCPEFGTKNAPEYECLHEAWKQPCDTISCQNNFITSVIFVVFFAYVKQSTTSFALKPSCYQSEVWERFVSDYDVYTLNKTVQVVPDPFSYHLLMRSRIVPDCWSRAYRIHAEPYEHDPNPIWKGIRYEGDPVSALKFGKLVCSQMDTHILDQGHETNRICRNTAMVCNNNNGSFIFNDEHL